MRLEPQGVFVIKWRTLRPLGGHESGAKVFVNVCSEKGVPVTPLEGTGAQFDVDSHLQAIELQDWQPEIALSEYRTTLDKSGVKSFVFDAVFNPTYINWTLASLKWKQMIAFLVWQKIDEAHEGLIDWDEMKFPKRQTIDEPRSLEFDANQAQNCPEQVLGEEDRTTETEAKVAAEVITISRPKGDMSGLSEEPSTLIIRKEDEESPLLVAKETRKITSASTKKALSISPSPVSYSIQMSSLEPNTTINNHTHLLIIKPSVPTAFQLQYDQIQKELIINGKFRYPLPPGVALFNSFLIKDTLHVYIKCI